MGTVAAVLFAGKYGMSAFSASAVAGEDARIDHARANAGSGRVLLGQRPSKAGAMADGHTSGRLDVAARMPTCSGQKVYDKLRAEFKDLFVIGYMVEVEEDTVACPTTQDAQNALWFAVAVLAFSIVIVLLVLAVIADAFFCPAVSGIVQQLHIPPMLAGVTLLPLGNGAPDVFSTIIAASKGNGEIGAGAIGGAGLFVVSVVLGTVFVVARPFRVPLRAFVRDCSFLFVGVAYFIFNANSGLINPAIGVFGTPLLYVVYVCFVVYGEVSRRGGTPVNGDGAEYSVVANDDDIEEPLLNSDDDHSPRSSRCSRDDENEQHAPEYSVVDYYFRAVELKSRFDFASGFVEDDVETAERAPVQEAPAILVPHEQNEEEQRERQLARMKSRRRSISFDAADPAFARDISLLMGSAGIGEAKQRSKTEVGQPPSKTSPVTPFGLHSSVSDKLQQQSSAEISSEVVSMTPSSGLTEVEIELRGPPRRTSPEPRRKSSARWQSSTRDVVDGGDGPSSSFERVLIFLDRVWAVVEFPVYWSIAFLVPQPDPEKFLHWVAVVNALTLPLTSMLFVSNLMDVQENPSRTLLAITTAVSVTLAALVHSVLRVLRARGDAPTARRRASSRVPPPSVAPIGFNDDNENSSGAAEAASARRRNRIDVAAIPHLVLTMTVVAFFTCIMLLSLTADVLVDYLVAVGKLLEIDAFTVGATILAWGNSAGDFLTDVAISRIPHAAPTAVAGAIAGPFFNLSIGLGIALCILAGREGASHFDIPGSDFVGSCLFLFLAACIVFVASSMAWTGYRSSRRAGVTLYVIYVIALTTVIILNHFLHPSQ